MIRHNSSLYTTLFVGRANELAATISRLLNPDCRLLTLTGLGGRGKARLALDAATCLAARFPHGTVFVALQAVTRGELLVPTIAQALGLISYSEADLLDQLLDFLQAKTLLLILDN